MRVLGLVMAMCAVAVSVSAAPAAIAATTGPGGSTQIHDQPPQTRTSPYYKTFRHVEPAPDGKLVGLYNPAIGPVHVARFRANVRRDPSFSGDGWTAPLPLHYAAALVVNADGSILVGGSRRVGRFTRPAVLRLTSAGRIDHRFGSRGVALVGPPTRHNSYASALAGDPSGGVTVARIGGLYRLRADGSADASFANQIPAKVCEAQPGFGPCLPEKVTADDVIRTRDGGYAALLEGQLTRFNADGTIRTQFGTDGVASINTQASKSYVVELPDRRLLVTGMIFRRVDTPRNQAAVMTALMPDGQVDLTFGQNGTARSAWVEETLPRRAAFLGGRIYLLSYELISAGYQPVLHRFTMDGRVDTAFGSGGMRLSPARAFPEAITATRDRIIISGMSYVARGGWIGRYRANGTLG